MKQLIIFCLSALCVPAAFSQTISRTVNFDPGNLAVVFSVAPLEFSGEAKSSPLIYALPMPEGGEQLFKVVGSPIMAMDFQSKFPGIKTYGVQSVENPAVTGRLTLTPNGFFATLLTPRGVAMIRPLDLKKPFEHEVAYDAAGGEGFACEAEKSGGASGMPKNAISNGATRRTFNLAVVTTGEFHDSHGGVAAATAVVTATVNGIQAIYDRELAIRFNLLTPFIYPDYNTDPFDPAAMLSRTVMAAQAVHLNFAVGTYDIGHVFHDSNQPPAVLGSGGVASFGVVCSNAPKGTGYAKAGGWSSNSSNTNLDWIRVATHEFGHMFDMAHSWNGSGESCTAERIGSAAAYEIGSGTTIMSYDGACDSVQNIPISGADSYFHAISLVESMGFISGLSCQSSVATGNTPPVVSANPCGLAYLIPKGTPFTLTGAGSDADGEAVYFAWEPFDEDGDDVLPTHGYLGAQAAASCIAPLFRSYPPTLSPSRTFPNMALVAANDYASNFEPLPTVARTLNFRLFGRDFNPNGGGIHCSPLALTVSVQGPFTVTSPNGGGALTAGSATTVTWNLNGISFLTNVNIKLSIDGGLTFPYALATNTPAADGSQSVTLPAGVANTTSARIMVESADNPCVVFFDISNSNFTVTSPCNAVNSQVCPATPLSLPAGNAGLNLGMSFNAGSPISQHTLTINGTSPTGIIGNKTTANGLVCQQPPLTEKYATFDFTVSQSGTYTFSKLPADAIVFSVFTAAGYNPAAPCASTLHGSNAYGNINLESQTHLALAACTTYKLVVWTLSGANATPTLTFSGPGLVYAPVTPGGNYGSTFAAVNVVNNQVAAVSATSDFTALGAGNYLIYGASYYAGAGPTPPVVNPATWTGQTLDAILAGGACVVFSINSRNLAVTGGGGAPSLAIGGSPSLNEGNAGSTAFTFTVTRSGNVASQTTVHWLVSGSGANPANGMDFTGGNLPGGMIAFPAGSAASQNLTVNVGGDLGVEPDEGFTVTLSNPVNATISTATASGTIQNDDTAAGCAATYCAASQTTGTCENGDEFIGGVMFHTINHCSDCSESLPAGYTDYTNIGTTVNRGGAYTLTVVGGKPVTNDECRAWFDWNANGDFTDAGEEYILTGSGMNNAEIFTVSVPVPAGATLGTTRMRARIAYNSTPPPCGVKSYGEAEDYCLTIAPVCAPPVVNAPTLTQPTCAVPTGTIVVNASGGGGALQFSVNGGVNWQANSAFDNLPSGNYDIRVRHQADTACFINYAGNPVVLNPSLPTYSNPCTSGDLIESFTFGTYANLNTGCANPGASNYSNYAPAGPTVQIGETYAVTIAAGGFNQYYGVYVDFNGNGSYLDAGEFFNVGQALANATVSLNLTIPASATAATRTMRVRSSYDAALTAADGCATNLAWGEIEDYVLSIFCPNNLTVSAVPIPAGTYDADLQLSSAGTVQNGASVIFRAGDAVNLLANFEVQLGGLLQVLMQGCY